MGRSAARWMDIEADNLLSTFPKISAGDVGCCYESPSSWKMQDIPGAALACKMDWKFFFFFLNWEPSIWWSVQQLNNNLKSILLDKQQGVSSLFSVSSSEHLNSVTVKCTQWALFAPVSWVFSHILLQAALTYTCIGALRKLNSFDLTEHFHPHTVMTSYPNEKNSSVNGQMGKMPLLGWSGANGLLFTTTTPPCWLQLQVRVQLLPWCRQ